MIKLKQNDGFSFIELVVMIAIVGLLATTVFINFSGVNFVKNQEAAILDFNYSIRKIQNYSLIGKKNVQNAVPVAYGIYIINDKKYNLFLDYNDDKVFGQDDVLLQSIDLPDGITISPSGGTITAAVPEGSFCYDDNNLIGLSDCDGETSFFMIIDGSNLSKKVYINHITGQVSYE